MKRFGLKAALQTASSLVLAAAWGAQAGAADLPVKAVPVAAVYDWTGFYVGVNGAAGLFDKRWTYLGPLAPAGDDGEHKFTGAFGGAQAGFNYQVGSWVVGVDAQADWGRARGNNASLLFANQSNYSLVDAFGLVSGRFGYALNNALLYVKGGAGVVHEKYEFGFDDFAGTYLTTATASETRWGPAAGLGFELAFTDHVTVAGEYNHVFLGRRDITFQPTGDIYRLRQDLDVFTVRVNYLFNRR